MSEESNTNLLSNSPDDFLSKPNTDVELPTAKISSTDERNVCVVVSFLENDETLLKRLMSSLSKLCTTNHTITDKHKVALQLLIKEANVVTRLGYCDELTASNIVFRVCKISKVNAKVYREYGTPKMREITEADLGKRPFRF